MDTETTKQRLTQKAWNIMVVFLFSFNLLFGTVPPVVAQPTAQEVLPTVTTDKADYQPGELVTVTGANWLADTQVHLVVNDAIGQTWAYDVILDVVDGGFTTAFNLPDTFISNYMVVATGVQSGQSAAADFTDQPALTVTKSASPVVYTAAGQTINYSYVVKNTGSPDANGIVVTDDKIGVVSCPSTSLAAGASMTCTGAYTTTSSDVTFGYVANKVTATATGGIVSNADIKIASIPVDCRVDTNGANDVPGQKDLTQECTSPTAVNPELISWNWDEITMSGGNSADACALFDTDGDGLANYAICVSWQGSRVMQAGYPVLYSCGNTRSDRCTGSTPLTISNGSACAIELAGDQPFPAGADSPNDTKAFCSVNLADVGGAAKSVLIDVCSYPSAVPNSDPSDCVLITSTKGNLEVIKNVSPDDPTTNWNISWTGPTTYSGTITGDGTTGIQAVDAGSYTITEAAGTGTDLSLYDSTWACTVDGAASTSGSGTTITGRSVAKGSVVICTFTNTRRVGTLEIKKDVVPDNSGTNWNFTVTGPDPTFTSCSIAGDGTCGAKRVLTGSYSITETAGSGTTLGDYGTTWACTVNGAAGPSGTGDSLTGLTINKSDTVVCTFTNSQSPGTITVNKVVKPSTDTGLFNLLVDGTEKATNVGDGGTTGAVSVSAGSHTVSETAGTGTDLNNYVTTITGDCDSSGSVSIGPNQTKTCTITNTRKGNIVIKKVTDPTGQAGDFIFTGAVSGTIQDGGQLTASNLAPGPYSVTETSLASDFALESITCDDTNSTGDVGNKKASITLDPGETVTCTFTNKKLFPNLVVTKTADEAAVTAGDPVGFKISVNNTGSGTAYNVTLSDTLPATPGVTWAIASQPAGDPCTLTGNSLACSFGSLAPNTSTGDIHITGTSAANSCGTWNNTATAQADNNGPATGSASIFVDCATIKITKTAGSATVSAGDPLSFTILVENDNSGTAHTVKVTDTLPANAGLGVWTLSGADAAACGVAAGVLTCNFGDVTGHASKTVTLTATTTAATCGPVSNTASVTTSNDGSGDSTAIVTVQCPNLSVTKAADAATVNAGDPVGFTITVHNAGPGVAKSVTLTDTLPSGLSWTVTAPASGCSISGQDLTCTLGNLASGADASVHVTATSTPATCGPLTNQTATATPTNGEAASSAPATVNVNCADVTVTKTGNGSISAGDTAAFTITVKVTGSGTLKNVTLNDPLPAGVTDWAIDPAITACSISGTPQVLNCAWLTLDAPQTITIVVSGTTSQANCAAPLSNIATVAAANETDTTNDTASDSIKVDCATIQIEKSTSTGTVSAGDPISYTITVSNPGTGIARNVKVIDTLPTNTGLNWSYPAACSVSGGVLTCSLGDIAGGGSKSVTLTSPTTAATCGTVSNTASVTTTNDGTGSAGPVNITVLCPRLNVNKTPDAAYVSAGDTMGYTITVSNGGPGEAKGVMISDSLPGGLAWTVDAANTTATGCSISGSTLTCGPDTIASGKDVKVHVTAVSTPAICGTLTNTATATPTNGDAATSQESTITVLCPDLTVAKSGNGPISAGDTAIYTITVKNIGAGEAKNVTLTDTLPGGLTWALNPANPACTISGSPQVLSCSWATLAPNASVSVSVSAVTTKDNCGTLTNSASAAATNEQNTSNNSSGDADLEVDCATIQIEKTTSTPTVSAGDPISYTITVMNPGLGTAKDVVVTDSLPGGLAWTIDAAHSDTGCSISGSTLTCAFGSVAGLGGSKHVTVTATTTADNCGTLTNTASVITSNDGAATTPAVDITVMCPNLSVTKTPDAATVSAGDTIGFTITVSNAGPGEAKGVMISDSLPGGLTWTLDAGNTTATGCSISGSTLTCGPDTIASGKGVKVHITAVSTPASCGTLFNDATATPTNGDAATSQTASITVQCPALTVTKTADETTVSAGDPIGFTITVKNTGAGIARNVSLSDTLPGGTGVSWSESPDNPDCTITGALLSCTFGDLAAGGTKTIHVTSPTTKDSCATYNNTATASATNLAAAVTSSPASTTVLCAGITMTKVADDHTVSAGDTIGFTIEATNPGPGSAYGVTITDTLPTNAGLDWTIDPSVQECSIAGDTLTCTVGTLPANKGFLVHISSPTTAETCGMVNNAALVSTTNDGSAEAGDGVMVNCPDVTVTKTAASGTISAGDSITFNITVTNAGAGTARSVTLSDTLPTGAGLNWSVGGTDAAACTLTAGVVTCSFGDLIPGAVKTITLTSPTTKDSCATYDNTATAAATNEPTGQPNNSSTASVDVLCANISITKTPNKPTVNAGDPVSFSITVTNNGAGTAKNIVITDSLPDKPGLSWTITSITPVNVFGSCQLNLIPPQKLTCNFDQLTAGQSVTVLVSSPTTLATACATLDNTASVTTSNDGSAQASASIAVTCANISITKTPVNATVSAGDPIAYDITVTNSGQSAASNVVITDSLPDKPGLSWTITSITPVNVFGSCQLNLIPPQTLTCNFDQLAAGQSVTVRVSSPTTYASCGMVSNTAKVTTSNDGTATTPESNITVNCPALQVTKTPDTQTVSAGEPISFTVNIMNTGGGTAKNVTLSDQLPLGMTWSVDNSACSVDANGLLTCAYGDLASGDSASVTVTGDTIPAMCGTFDNTATVKMDNGPDVKSNTVSVTVNCADVTVTKEAVTGTISAGDTAAFKIVVKNIGAGTAYGVTLTDTLPAGVIWTIDPAVAECSITGNTLSCSWPSLAAGASVTINLSGPTDAADCGKLDNSVTVAANNEAADQTNNQASASITVNCADVTVTKTAVTGTINAGDTAAFKIVVSNVGAGTAYNVTVNDTLPAGIVWTIDPTVTGCSITGNTLSCSFATLAAAASVTINVSGPTSAALCGKLDNTATVAASNETNTSNNSASASITVNCSDVTVTKEAVTGIINAGDTAAFKIVVSNAGAGTAYNVTVSDTLPAGIAWTIDPAVTGCAITGNMLSCSFATLAAGASVAINVSGTTSAAHCGKLDNTVTVAASNETNTDNNSASASITVNCSDVTVTKEAVLDTINSGDKASFKIVVTNSGAGTAYNVTVSDTLPGGLAWTIDPAVTGCAISGSTLSCSFATLAAGASVEINVSAQTNPAVCGVLDNTVTVAASNEANKSNNTASASITVNCPDVKVTKTAENASIHLGQDAVFNIVVENIGAGKAYNVTLTDTLPGSLTWSLVQPVPGCTLTGNNLSCAWASLDPAAKIPIQVKATITTTAQCANLTNTVTAAAANEKASDTANNTSTATITVSCPLDLTIAKTANPTFTREYCWGIYKVVDRTEVRTITGSATFNYRVNVKEVNFCDEDWMVTGKITVTNPNDWLGATLTSLTDRVNNGATCTISGFTPGMVVPASQSVTLDYTCSYDQKPANYSGTNTATVTWDGSIQTPNATATATANFEFGTGAPGNPTRINQTVTITDTFNGITTVLGQLTATDTPPYVVKNYTYSRTIPVTCECGCQKYTNTAKIVETRQSFSVTVKVCGPVKTGAKTIGYWQNNNGQAIIKNTASVSGVCKLATWLRQFAPFKDLSSTASCATTAAYVFNVIKAANAGGASMNAMLKAQMLATALNIYYSNPALGGNKINAPTSIGSVTVDLTYIYAGGKFVNVSSAFGGATKLTVMQMLNYAASKSNSGGWVWYSNAKSTQELAKDAFDAINNQWAFAP